MDAGASDHSRSPLVANGRIRKGERLHADIALLHHVTGLFADPAFDGPPVRTLTTSASDDDAIEEPIEIIEGDVDDTVPDVAEPPGDFDTESGGTVDVPQFPDPGDGCIVDDDDTEDTITHRGTKHVVSGIDVMILGELLTIAPPSDEGSVIEIASRFGGPAGFRAALDELSWRPSSTTSARTASIFTWTRLA